MTVYFNGILSKTSIIQFHIFGLVLNHTDYHVLMVKFHRAENDRQRQKHFYTVKVGHGSQLRRSPLIPRDGGTNTE